MNFVKDFFRYLWLSCSGFRTYVPLLNLPMYRTLLYWAGWSLILSVVLMANLIQWFQMGFRNIEKVAPSLPAFSLSNGVAYSSLSQPYYANTNHFPIILDLEGKVAAPEKTFPSGVVVHKRELKFWIEGARPGLMSWSGWPNGTVNADYLKSLQHQTFLVLPFIFVILWLIVIAMGMIQAWAFSIFVGLMEKHAEPAFNFKQLFNIALFSITPCSVIVATYISLRLSQVNYSLIYFCAYCFVLIMASGACRASLRPPEDQELED